MPSYTIGPKIGLDGEKEFRDQLNNINEQLRTLESELKKTASEFEDNADSEEALTRQKEILTKEIDAQEKKIIEIKKALEYSEKAYGENSTQTLKWQRILNNAETDLNGLKSKLKSNEQALSGVSTETKDADKSLEKFSKSASEASDKSEKLSKAANGVGTGLKALGTGVVGVAGAIGAGISGINNLAESTREYREDIGKLETAFATAGISQEAATETYKDFFSVLGEEDRSVEAVNHLAKLTKSQEDLEKWTNICAGVWGTFGDSLPIEGLTEAANETSRTGTVTGVLADALNWAGISEDEFNEKLASCQTQQERSALITNTLNNLYSKAADNYREANAEVIAARKAQSELTDATAKLGEAAEPVSTIFKQMGADILNSIVPGAQKIGEGITGILTGDDSTAAEDISSGVSDIISAVLEQINEMLPLANEILSSLIPQLFQSIISQAPALLQSVMQILMSLVSSILSAAPAVLQAVIDIIVMVGSTLAEQAPVLIDTLVQVLEKMLLTLTDPENLNKIFSTALDLILSLAIGLIDAIPELISVLPEIIANLVTELIILAPELTAAALQLIMALASGLFESRREAAKMIPKIIEAMKENFENFDFAEWGRDMIEELIKGLLSMVTRVRNAVSDIADIIASYLHFSLPDEGPLREANKWMPDMIDVLTQGIYQNQDKVRTAALSLADMMKQGLNMGADLTNIYNANQELTVNAPVYLDGKKIADSTQKYITNQQNARAFARGKVNVRF